MEANFLGLAHRDCGNRTADCEGRLSALQTVTIASALQFLLILMISIYGLLKDLPLLQDLTKRESLSMAKNTPTSARYRLSAESFRAESFAIVQTGK